MIEYTTHSDSETEEAGKDFALSLHRYGNIKAIGLYGDLGAGKTAFVRGMASFLSPGSRVKSPTFTIVNEYKKGPVPIFHFDVFRINAPEELYDIGIDDYLEKGLCIIEWSQKIDIEKLTADYIKIYIDKTGPDSRHISIITVDEREDIR